MTLTYRDYMDALSKLDVGTVGKWRAAGLTTSQIRSLASKGELVRYRMGVYVRAGFLAKANGNPAVMQALRVAAVTAGQSAPGAVASHQSAALMHGLDLLEQPPGDLVWLTRRPGTYRGRSAPGVRLHSAGLPSDHVTTLYGVAVTTAARTVVDLARSQPFMAGVVVADSALHLGKTTPRDLSRMLRCCAGWPGIGRASRVAESATELSESVLETCARVIFAEAGLPPPRLQANVIRNGEFIGRVDFCWEQHRTIAEADGMAKYENPQRARDEIRRDRLLREAGYKVVHFTWAELFGAPDRVIARLREAFAAPTPY